MRDANGFTLVELLIVTAIVGVLAAIGAPGLLRARMSSNEASAIGSLRAINSGQASFSSSCAAAGGYAIDLADLAQVPPGTSQGFISPDLYANDVVKSGYRIAIARDAAANVVDVGSTSACNGTVSQPATSYFANAVPVTLGGSGTRYFATDQRGTIFYDSAVAIANPIPAGSPFIVQ